MHTIHVNYTNKHNQTIINVNKTLLAKAERYKTKLNKKQETYDENNVFCQNAMKEKKKVNQDNQLTKKTP